MKLKVISFTWDAFSNDDVVSLTFVSKMWEITILNNHEPLITDLRPWILKIVYKDKHGAKHVENFAIGWWIVEIQHSDVKVLADMLVSTDSLDVKKAEEAEKEARELMEKYKHSKDIVDMEKFIEAQDMLMKSIAQLKLYEIKK